MNIRNMAKIVLSKIAERVSPLVDSSTCLIEFPVYIYMVRDIWENYKNVELNEFHIFTQPFMKYTLYTW